MTRRLDCVSVQYLCQKPIYPTVSGKYFLSVPWPENHGWETTLFVSMAVTPAHRYCPWLLIEQCPLSCGCSAAMSHVSVHPPRSLLILYSSRMALNVRMPNLNAVFHKSLMGVCQKTTGLKRCALRSLVNSAGPSANSIGHFLKSVCVSEVRWQEKTVSPTSLGHSLCYRRCSEGET